MSEYRYRLEALRSGVRWRELRAIGEVQITANASSVIGSSLAATLEFDAEVNLLRDEIKAYQIINGVESPLGIYICTTAQHHYEATGRHSVTIEAYDRGVLATQTTTETRLHLAAGTKYIDAVEQLLNRAGIVHIQKAENTETLSTEREDWDTGTSLATIINELLAEINYSPLHFNLEGYAVLSPAPIDGEGTPRRSYNELDPGARVMRTMQDSVDIFDAPNAFLVICDNPELPDVITARAENRSPVSRLSIQARGRKITSVTRVDNIASQAELDKYAQRLCYESMTRAESVIITTAKMAGNELYDAIGLNLNGVQGIFTEKGWTIRLGAGEQMTHTLERRVFY